MTIAHSGIRGFEVATGLKVLKRAEFIARLGGEPSPDHPRIHYLVETGKGPGYTFDLHGQVETEWTRTNYQMNIGFIRKRARETAPDGERLFNEAVERYQADPRWSAAQARAVR